MMVESGSLQDQVLSPFVKKMLNINSPSAEVDSSALGPTPPQTPTKLNNASTRSTASLNRSQTKRPRRSIGPYQLARTLGSGSMGKVKLAINVETNEKFAVKIIPRKPPIHKNTPKDESRDIRIHREIALMMLLNHPYIVSLKEAMVMPHHYYLFFEYVSGGQILDYIISHGKLKEKNARKFARQMLSAIEYCHRHSVVHRDLKIENILITEDGSIKIIDFGLSNLFSPRSNLSTFCGSLYFAAPELLSAQEYKGPEVDIWSLGIVFYVLVCGRVPFDDPNMPALHAKIKKGAVSYPSWLSKECKHLLSRMLVTNPAERATMTELLKHPWICKGYDEPINIYYPTRQPIQLPLDMEVIQRMKGFEFGSDEKIKSDLEELLTNTENPAEASNPKLMDLRKKAFFNKTKGGDSLVYDHPLVSIYHLVREKLEREKRADASKLIESNNIPTSSNSKSSEILPEAGDVEVNNDPDSDKQKLTDASNKGVKFNTAKQPRPTSEYRNNNVLRRLSSAVRTGKSPLFHRLSHGPEGDYADSSKEGYGEKIGRRISRLITRHTSMQEPKMRNSLSELDALVETSPKPPEPQSVVNSPPQPKSDQAMGPPSVAEEVEPENQEAEAILTDTSMIPKTASLKGLFSVSTTSTRKAKAINKDIISALQKLDIKWRAKDGYLECIYVIPNGAKPTPSDLAFHSEGSSDQMDSEAANNLNINPTISANQSGLAESSITSPASVQTELSSAQVSTKRLSQPQEKGSLMSSNASAHQNGDTSAKEESSSAAKSKSVVKFQISLIKIRVVLRLHGIQFRRLEGPSWEYKKACSKILEELKL